ncbi:MOSC domain-containing protein, partial [Salmonella enterica subsp. enterica serovar Kentucky]|nr:MOSC domain-containing protein [Salmonella enterica subsp. enterica serovar Kentucky]
GPDRALCHYPREHYADWIRQFPEQATLFCAPAFGENLSTNGMAFGTGEAITSAATLRGKAFLTQRFTSTDHTIQLMVRTPFSTLS